MNIDLRRFHASFFEESFEGLDLMEQALLRIDLARPDAETINGVFRAAHSIKGGAGTFGFSAVADFTHGVETLLDRVRGGQHLLAAADVELLLRAVDTLRSLLLGARDAVAVDPAAVAAVQADLQQRLQSAAQPATPAAALSAAAVNGWQIHFLPRPDLFRSGNDPLRILQALAALGVLDAQLEESNLPGYAEADAESCYLGWNLRLQSACTLDEVREVFAWVEDECELTIQPIAAPEASAPSATAPAAPQLRVLEGGKPPAESSSIRVATDKIDQLINLVGELVITQAMLQQLADALDPVVNERLINGLQHLDRNTRQLQEAVMSTRMLPIDSVFSRFPRTVRDLAARLGKQVRLQTVGEATELDKSVIEKISDPLNHLVRNSLDHGIELPQERIAAGKDACGCITLRASHQGGHIVIEVADDGRGLDRERILAKAAERGIAVAPAISDAEVWQLIFAPGFSTAAEVTDVSGRGVGMDVVKKNIQALGGQVELSTSPGHGAGVTIRLPLTLAILDGMSIAAGGEIFIVPLSSVIESLQPQPEQVKRIARDGSVVRVRNEYLPLIDLQHWFGLGGGKRAPHEAIVVIVEADGRKLALQVDELVGQQQVVVKNLETNYRRVRGVSGATILGDGRVSLILDVGGIVRLSGQAEAA